MVKRMAPIIPTGTALKKPSYKPLLDNLYDAAKI
jgi:hypothetical protein